ncbi:MAG: rod shape-determining protein [Rickettsiales bacterium]|jgi:cell division protein FtsA|nr:rod shape-determining protein [Rickettsiales bacterium]
MAKTLACIDIGGSKIACLVGETDERSGCVLLKSADIRESRGIDGGNIINVKEFIRVVEKVVSNVEKICGQNIKSVFVNLAGDDAQSSLISLEKPMPDDGKISRNDIYKISGEIIGKFEADDKEVIQAVLVSSNRDENNTIKYTFNVICAVRKKTNKIKISLAKLNIGVENFVCNSFASSLCIGEYETSMRIALAIDFGYEFTDFCVLQNGKTIYNDSIRLAGKILTQDIATILRIPFGLAEEVKIKNVTLLLDVFEERENIRVSVDGGEDSFRVAKEKRKLVNDVFFARMEEIVYKIKSILEKKKLFDKIDSVIITGGTSNTFGLEKFVEDKLGLKTKKIFINNFEVNNTLDEEKIRNPIYSTALGLLSFASKMSQQREIVGKNSPFGNFVNGLLQNLINLFIS